ncbi:hypothetical protein [Neobacillus cucumis]|uniref:hypothetical protein n=1 Tax=Neobacillus cucumis TaxID=1740721 RepID=UPI0028532007|nr:hypothetical protein [Neobacillus cucumis]MDR4946536.1 hypothetical protein [Neobacillus cucumis]
MNSNYKQERKNIKDLRKKATTRTMLINKETYKKINWSKGGIENNLGKTGMVI